MRGWNIVVRQWLNDRRENDAMSECTITTLKLYWRSILIWWKSHVVCEVVINCTNFFHFVLWIVAGRRQVPGDARYWRISSLGVASTKKSYWKWLIISVRIRGRIIYHEDHETPAVTPCCNDSNDESRICPGTGNRFVPDCTRVAVYFHRKTCPRSYDRVQELEPRRQFYCNRCHSVPVTVMNFRIHLLLLMKPWIRKKTSDTFVWKKL